MTGFDEAVTPLRGELLAHCYRMLGSRDEAEDAVQETLLRAWRGWDGFDGRASARTWAHRIATNVCLDAIRARRRTAVPTDDLRAVQPFPDDRADLRLALVVGLQLLGPTQRAVFLLREVLGFPAAEVAAMLGTTVPAVKSSLQRARARLGDAAVVPEDVVEPRSAAAGRLLDVYVRAFETGDAALLVAALRDDAVLDLVAEGQRFDGKLACAAVLASAVGRPGEWRLVPTVANGQPAASVHRDGEPYGVAVLDVRRDGIAGIAVFAGTPSTRADTADHWEDHDVPAHVDTAARP